jgi:1,4-alpha-glucan branching enzyme
MFRLCDQEMYWSMDKASQSMTVDRGIALHKLLRLLTASLGGEGYLTFMGNEFGHPEWIDFPREGNGWSYHYCRRQWHLADDPALKYEYLQEFEKAMVKLLKDSRVHSGMDRQLALDNSAKTMVYQRGKGIFAFNFHPVNSYDGLFLPMPEAGKYEVVLSSDDFCFGGQGRIYHETYETIEDERGRIGIKLYLPSRTAAVLKKK